MKFFIPALAVIGAIAIILSLIFSAQLLLKAPGMTPIKSSAAPGTTSTSSLMANTSSGTNISGSAPAGFHGPASPPHIIGPSSPPPNY